MAETGNRSRFFWLIFFLVAGLLPVAAARAAADRPHPLTNQFQNNFKEAGTAEKELFRVIRRALSGKNLAPLPQNLNFSFQPEIAQIYITLLQSGNQPLRWGARRKDLAKTLKRVIAQVKSRPRFTEFNVSDPDKCRILFEIVTAEKEGDLKKLDGNTLHGNRFEPGITGLKYSCAGITRYFMPTDAIMHSIMSVKQLLNFIAKKSGIAPQTTRKSERIKLLLKTPIKCKLLTSRAWISYKTTVLPLYRGAPMLPPPNKKELYASTINGVDWLYDNMYDDGRFLYYYDGIKDSRVDFIHPRQQSPLYYNILRHSGGTIALLWGYELTGEIKYLKAAKKSLEYLQSTFITQTETKDYACFPFFNHKSKLGGAGVGLVALVKYTLLSGDNCFAKAMTGLVRHILSRIDKDGEMIGYYIHPKYNQGKPLINPQADIKKELFSFYYPGEALLGLALYYRYIENKDEKLRLEILRKSRKALDFLVEVRPQKYADLFPALPADAWLMQAIEEWVKVPGCKKAAYIDFVFRDTDALASHMYKAANSLYPDYPGGFYYKYGDHVYHDASRGEGVMAAYRLAQYLKDDKRARQIMKNMLISAYGIMYLRQTPQSTFAHLYPQKSCGSFRFKLTRAWIRVDSTQHAVCFLARLYQSLP